MDFRKALRGMATAAVLIFGTQSAMAQPPASNGSSPPHLNPACQAGQKYIAYGNVSDPVGIASIFAEKVDYTGPDGVKRQDQREIAALYASFTGKSNVQRRIVHLAPIGPNACLMEMENSEDGGAYSPSAIAHFEVDSHGKVIRFLPFILSSRGKWMTDILRK